MDIRSIYFLFLEAGVGTGSLLSPHPSASALGFTLVSPGDISFYCFILLAFRFVPARVMCSPARREEMDWGFLAIPAPSPKLHNKENVTPSGTRGAVELNC